MIRIGSGFVVESSSHSKLVGTRCLVTRRDESTGFFWLLSVDLAKNDSAYRNVEFGPYCAADVAAGKLKKAKVHRPKGLDSETLDDADELRGQFQRKSTR